MLRKLKFVDGCVLFIASGEINVYPKQIKIFSQVKEYDFYLQQ